ncbi:MAG: dTDP-4-dehydrorhamnose reductase, partial [Chlamydiia bacterium]|nr:dTDP-4-dehydrorhamnose reductase [Chlamydiia bacterium]
MPKNILITGSNGQLGQEFRNLVERQDHGLSCANFYFTDRDSLDITNKDALEIFIETNTIDTIINCAAYTAVDDAEKNEVLAYKVNRDAVKILAELALDRSIQLIHLSTDYVFDSNKHTPFNENDATNPQGVYGKSKLAGEDEIRRINPTNAIIIRTSWVYSSYGSNFVHTMLKLGQERKELNIICDQMGTPTYARDLARTILTMLAQDLTSNTANTVALYNYSNEGSCSWYDFAQAIFELTNIKCKVNPISTEEYPTPAKRPHYSVLNKNKIKKAFNLQIPYWRNSLKECLQVIDFEVAHTHKIGIIGSGFIASGLAKLLIQHKDYDISGILTRSDVKKRSDFAQNNLLTNSLEELVRHSDLIVECSGDAVYATETIDRILKTGIPVVTMNSEFHVTTGSYFVDKGLITEAEGD